MEYLHQENATVGVGPGHEGMLIAAVNLGLDSYLGSPDYFYVYRPNDPFFRGQGNPGDCLFGKAHRRTEFNLSTEPSARLPNLLDGGVAFRNIEEHQGTLSFEVVIDRNPVTGSAYDNSMLPQIRLAYDTEGVTRPIRWAVFDGINSKGQFHVDFPRNTKVLLDGEWQTARSGYCRLQDLLLPLYQTQVVTSCFYPGGR